MSRPRPPFSPPVTRLRSGSLKPQILPPSPISHSSPVFASVSVPVSGSLSSKRHSTENNSKTKKKRKTQNQNQNQTIAAEAETAAAAEPEPDEPDSDGSVESKEARDFSDDSDDSDYSLKSSNSSLKYRHRNRPSVSASPSSSVRVSSSAVDSAVKLAIDSSLEQRVFLIRYSSHSLRLIRVVQSDSGLARVFLHAGDAGNVVERRSNVSRLLSKFESPKEKILMTVIGAHNNRVGQEANVLTRFGVRRLLQTKKCRENKEYVNWINQVILPIMEGNITIEQAETLQTIQLGNTAADTESKAETEGF